MRRILLSLFMVCTAAAAWSDHATAQDNRDLCFSIGSDAYKDPQFGKQAIAACDRLIAARRSTASVASALRARGYWKHGLKDLNGALADLTRAVELDPENVEGYDYRADVYEERGDLVRAIADREAALKINPDYIPGHYGRGVLYEKLGDKKRARESYEAALTLPPKDRADDWAHSMARKKLEALNRAR